MGTKIVSTNFEPNVFKSEKNFSSKAVLTLNKGRNFLMGFAFFCIFEHGYGHQVDICNSTFIIFASPSCPSHKRVGTSVVVISNTWLV